MPTPAPAQPYAPPLDQLLTLGDARETTRNWPDYSELGIGPEHVSELVRMTEDTTLLRQTEESPLVWAGMHAWRALGQLRAEEAIDPLLRILTDGDPDDDYAHEEIPRVLGMIGPAALPALDRTLDLPPGEDDRFLISATEAVTEIAERHPETRGRAVALLTRKLERFAENGESLNGFLVGALLKLGAAESAPLIERAFAAGVVDLTISGDWEDAQVELGLLEKRITPRRNYIREMIEGRMSSARHDDLDEEDDVEAAPPPAPSARTVAKAKAKKKQEKLSRKKNRKR